VTAEYVQLKHFKSAQALNLFKHKGADLGAPAIPRRSLARYYIRNPGKALKRAKSLILDGLCVKTITLHAQLITGEPLGK
jgi:hypothetical protein